MKSPNLPTNYICKVSLFFTFFLILLPVLNLVAQQKAFPTAYGGGAYSTGGRGGNVYHVTNLEESGPGSFAWALGQPRPATIVFDVSGVINSSAWVDIGGSDLTIAGQSAPVGGITIASTHGARTRVRGDGSNLIIRYLRVRPATKSGDDAFELFTDHGYSDVIFDHMSVSYGGDETFSLRGNSTHNITIQNSIIAEGKTGSLLGSSGSTESGFQWNYSYLNNLNYNISHRSPNMNTDQRADIINNVNHDWGQGMGAMFGDMKLNHINNYYSLGSRNALIGSEIEGQEQSAHTADIHEDQNPRIYTAGNVSSDGRLTASSTALDNRALWWKWKVNPSYAIYDFRQQLLPSEYFVNSMYTQVGAPMPIKPAEEAKDYVVNNAGANASLNADGTVTRYTDVQDTRYLAVVGGTWEHPFYPYTMFDQVRTWWEWDTPEIRQALNNKYGPYMAANGINDISDMMDDTLMYDAFVAFVNSQGATPINTRPDNFYVSNPHIPEAFLISRGLTGTPTIHNEIAPSGYTWLEEYLNQVDSNVAAAIGVEGVEVLPSTAELQAFETITLTTTFTPSNATNQSGVWSSSDESIATVNQNGIVTAVSDGVVTITFTTNDGGFTDTSEITVFPEALQASAGDDQQICAGETATLTASGGTYYVWNNGETTATIEVTPTETTIYTVTVSDDNGQSDEDSVTVTVNAIPNASAGEDQTICMGESITLTASGGDSYLWSTGETTDSIEVNPITETTYSVEVSSNGCSSSDDITIFVNDAPNITVTEDLVIIEGDSATLTVNGGENYLWSTGETTESITVSPTATTLYTVSSTGPNGCTSSVEVEVVVIPEVVAIAGEDVTICDGESVTLSASGGVSYIWDNGEIGAEIIVNPTITTTYTVTVEDDYGFTDTDSVTVFVNDSPDIYVEENNMFVMIGNSVTLSAFGGNTYSWSTGETTSSISVSPDITTTYTVTGFSENGCQNTAEVLVTVVEELNANAGEDVSICIGDSVTLNASGGISYNWNTGDIGATQTFSPTETTTYTVTVTDGFGNSDSDEVTVTVNEAPIAYAGENQTVCEGEPVVLTAEGGDSYLWSTGETNATITVTTNTETTYTVEVFSNNCSDTDEVTVFTIDGPEVTVSEDITIMTGGSTTLFVSGADSYLWSTGESTDSIVVNPTETTTYTVTGFSTNGCQSTAQVTVTVIPELIANAGNDVTICNGESVTLNATGGTTYTWNTGDTGSSPTFSPSVTTTYTVTVTDGFGNSDTDSVVVTVNDLPSIAVSDNITIIEGESTNLVVSGADAYLWSTGEVTNSITVSPIQTTTYTVIGTTDTCSVEAQVTVTVDGLFVASAGSDERVCDNDTYEVVLTANQGDSYLWSTGETTQSITVSPLSTTNYTVTVTQGDQVDSDDVTVYVDLSPDVVIANGDSVDILNGDFVTLAASGANSYEWNNGATQPNIAVSPSTTTTYEVKGYVGECYDEKQVTVNVYEPVVANAGEDVFICLDEVATLTATGGDEYVWSTGETTQSIQVSPTQTTEYTVTVFNPMHFDEATVTVDVDTDCDTGEPIDEEESVDFSFDIFPNPANNTVNVKISGELIVSNVHIYDLTGKLVKSTEISNDDLSPSTTTQIDISSLQSGVYIVKLIDQDRVSTEKLIVE